ncbi:MAG: cysteine synthase [Cuniculiplasma sp. C_DKE]|jgi:cysteine synthase A|nr:MAG: cysteine synthase [Cuniculiplasma sp. C_DKE]WMT48815.1 MAG: cysteine synthase family protein [Thermoplasmatales archaeon]
MKSVLNNILGAVGETPLVHLKKISEREKINVYAKIEYFNPGLSIKDRVAIKFIEEAEKNGKLRPGSTVIERTSGNMGTGLAIVCAVKGYKFIAVMSEGNSVERRRMLSALGAEVVLVPQAPSGKPGFVSGEDLELVETQTKELASKLNAYRPDQFNNPDGAKAHEETTGQEIWSQMDGKIDAFVTYVGSGGTFVGTSRALKNHNKNVKCFVVEPESAPYLAGKKILSTRHRIQGGGYAFKPPFWDNSLVDGYLTVSDEEAMNSARNLAAKEGIFAGYSSGANVAACLKTAEVLEKDSCVVTILPDSGLKYLSTDLFI